MSSIIHIRGEAGGGVAAHLQCPHCGHFSNSHAHQLSHVAAAHPAQLDRVAVGRLGNILMYQSGARLFHCSDCFYTSRDFSKIYKHIISKHCTDQREGGEEEEEEDEEEARKDAPVRKRSSEAEEEEEEGEESLKGGAGAEQSVLMFDGAGYRCLICGWKNKMKALGVNHVVRKHDIPKAYASQAIRRDAASTTAGSTTAASTTASTSTTASSTAVTSLLAAPPEEEEEETAIVGLSGELLKEEVEATAKVVRFISNRFVCLICGWKTKLKGFAISHVVRFHDVERPYGCKDCARSFFLPSRLQQHVRAAHRPGRYACPFCCFRSHFLGGFRRHCSRCNAREEGGGEGEGRRGARGEQEEEEAREQQQEEEEEERKEVRGRRKRRRTRKAMEEEEEEEEEQEDDD